MTKNKSYKKRKSHKKRKSDLKKAREAAAVFSVLLLAIALCAVFWGGNKDKIPTDAESDISALTEAEKETEKSATEALVSLWLVVPTRVSTILSPSPASARIPTVSLRAFQSA